MPSSISSSSPPDLAAGARTPPGPWLKTWLLAITLVAVVLGGGELFWRERGFRPSVKDNAELWSRLRSRLDGNAKNGVVLLGSSRTQVGLNPRVLSAGLGQAEVVQLAIDGSSPVPILKDLAEDSGFAGVVVCEVAPTMFFAASRDSEAKPSEWLARHRSRSLVAALEVPLRAAVEKHAAIFLPQLSPPHLLEALLEGQLPRPHYVRMEPDRLKVADFSMVDKDKVLDKWERRFTEMGRVPDAAELQQRLALIDGCVRSIQHRGGQVVFLHMVSSGAVRAVEEQRFPRRQFWDVFAATTSGLAIHYADLPSLSLYTCADGSHLDGRQASSFSAALAGELDRRGVCSSLRTDPDETDRHARKQENLP